MDIRTYRYLAPNLNQLALVKERSRKPTTATMGIRFGIACVWEVRVELVRVLMSCSVDRGWFLPTAASVGIRQKFAPA